MTYANFVIDGISYKVNDDGKTARVECFYSINENVVIPDKVDIFGESYKITIIEKEAFCNCKKMKSLVIGDFVTEIGDKAFHDCSNLTEIIIGKSVSILGEDVFCLCNNLENISVDSANTNYDSRDNCNALIETASNTLLKGGIHSFIPNSVKEIASQAFDGNSSLSSIFIPASVEKIDLTALDECRNLTSIVVDENNRIYDSRDNCNALIESESNTLLRGYDNSFIPNSVKEIASHAFAGNKSLKSIIIPAAVERIGEDAFHGCCNLTSIIVDENNKKYDSRENCNALIETASNTLLKGGIHSFIPNSVKEIASRAFAGNKSLKSIIIPAAVERIDEDAFHGCCNLTSIIVDENNKKYDSRENCNALIETASNTLLKGCARTFIPSTVSELGVFSFCEINGLVSLSIPNSIKEIKEDTFYYCYDLEEVLIDKEVYSIDFMAFNDCLKLKTLIFRSPKTKIGFDAFDGCDNLSLIKVPKGSLEFYKKQFNSEVIRFEEYD